MEKEITLNEEYIHYKNGLSYTPVDFCKIQENDIWIEAIIYKTDTNELFVRSKKEFLEKFSQKQNINK